MGVIKMWKCLVCGEVVRGETPPEKCPVCGVGPDRFELMEEQPVHFKSSSLDQIIIIGNGVAGFTACKEIRKRNVDCRVEIITSENVVAYNRPMLTKGILEELKPEEFFIQDFEWYHEHSIKITLDTNVDAIELKEKKLKLSDGTERTYDKLIIATGAECNVIPLAGVNQKGIFTIRKLGDLNLIKDALAQVKDVVVIGGGVLGLESAWEFAKDGKKVTILEAAERIMKNQLDEKASTLLKLAAEKQGVTVVEEAKIDSIMGDGHCSGVKMVDGREFPCQLLIISAGIKPNAAVGVKAGLAGDRWIEVNANMETSQPGVYACGDVASYRGVSIGIWNQGLEMGRVAGANAVGDHLEYLPIIPSNSYEGMGTSLFSIGDVGRNEQANYEILERFEEEKGLYQKCFFLDDQFCGGILMGDVALMPKMLKCYEEKASKAEVQAFF